MENLSTPQNKPLENTDFKLPQIGQQLTYPLDHVTQEIIRDFVSTIVPQSFPVGSIFISTVATNPSELLGYGTWEAFGAGKTLIGIDAGDADFDTVEETGGQKTHTLSDNELPAHTFNIQGTASGAWGVTAGSTYGTITGGGASFDIMNPYIVTYMWKRLT